MALVIIKKDSDMYRSLFYLNQFYRCIRSFPDAGRVLGAGVGRLLGAGGAGREAGGGVGRLLGAGRVLGVGRVLAGSRSY